MDKDGRSCSKCAEEIYLDCRAAHQNGFGNSIRLADHRMETDMVPEGDDKVEQMKVNYR